jgi:hypothetical protein
MQGGGGAYEVGFEPIDAGPLSMSRHLEPLPMTWIKLAYARGMGREFGFETVRGHSEACPPLAPTINGAEHHATVRAAAR